MNHLPIRMVWEEEGAGELDTGGEPLFTHWVCAEYMVGSETKYPAWTHWVHFD